MNRGDQPAEPAIDVQTTDSGCPGVRSLDVATTDPTWEKWSAEALAAAANEGQLAINPIIYAEVSIGYATVERLDNATEPISRP